MAVQGPLRRLRFRRDHRWSGEHMSEYVDGELPESARERIERHLAECEDCRGLLGGLRGIVGGLAALRRERRAGPSVAPRVAAGVRAGIEGDDGRDV
jgi:anti-sigma factor RsiW